MYENNHRGYTNSRGFWASVSLAIALIVIGAPSWVMLLTTLFVFLPCIFNSDGIFLTVFFTYSFARPVLYVFALISAIKGPQDFIAIAFYVVAAVQVFAMVQNIIICIMSVVRSHDEY